MVGNIKCTMKFWESALIVLRNTAQELLWVIRFFLENVKKEANKFYNYIAKVYLLWILLLLLFLIIIFLWSLTITFLNEIGSTSWLIYSFLFCKGGFPGGSVVRNPPVNAEDTEEVGSIPGSERSPGGGNGTPIFLPGEFHGQRILVGYSLWGLKELDMTEHSCTCTSYPVNLCIKYVTLCIIFILFLSYIICQYKISTVWFESNF